MQMKQRSKATLLAVVAVIPFVALLSVHFYHYHGAKNDESAQQQQGQRRRLSAYHRWIDSTFVISNRAGINATDFVTQGHVPGYLGLQSAYEGLAIESVKTFRWTKYIPSTAEIVSVEDIHCPSCIIGEAWCQRVRAQFEMGMHFGSPGLVMLPQVMTDIVNGMIEDGDLRQSTQDLVVNVVNGDPVCHLVTGESIALNHPAGVEEGYISNSPNDLGLRFSKNPKMDPPYWLMDDPEYFQLGAQDYPITFDMAKTLRNETAAISVMQDEDCLECIINMTDLINATKVVMTYPENDPASTFWNELWEVIYLQLHRRSNSPIEPYLKLPKIWTGYSIGQVAEAVRNDYPGTYHVELIKQLFGGGLDTPHLPNCEDCAVIDRSIIPSTSSASFLRGVVMLADLCTWAFGAVGPQNFQTKWHVGRPRPEEVVWKIYNGELTESDGVPSAIVTIVKTRFELDRMQDFTAYSEGSPDHPSFPAMHSASSAASIWLAVVLDLTHEQWCEVKAVDYAVAYGRTVAGVHYHTDNIAGLNLGQEILARLMPDHFAAKYGSDPDAVRAKIQKLRFDWNDYLTSDCFDDDE